MHKPFKKTHQNIREDEDDVQSRTPEEKGRFSSGTTWLKRVDEEREMQNYNVVFLPFWFYIFWYIWAWIKKKKQNITQVSSLGSLHQ